MELVKPLMKRSYTLVWTDYSDNLDNHHDIIQDCLNKRSCESLEEKVYNWYSESEWTAVCEAIGKLKEKCIKQYGFDEDVVDAFSMSMRMKYAMKFTAVTIPVC